VHLLVFINYLITKILRISSAGQKTSVFLNILNIFCVIFYILVFQMLIRVKHTYTYWYQRHY